jgi:hypothetical protein
MGGQPRRNQRLRITTAVRRRWAIAAVERYEEQYRKTRNPVLAWRAYLECRGAKLRFPEWVLQYLDGPAQAFWEWSMSGRVGAKNLDAEIADALGMRRDRRGRGNVFDEVFPHKRTMELACGVHLRLPNDKKLYLAIENTAKEKGVHISTVKRAWAAHGKELLQTLPPPRRGSEIG